MTIRQFNKIDTYIMMWDFIDLILEWKEIITEPHFSQTLIINIISADMIVRAKTLNMKVLSVIIMSGKVARWIYLVMRNFEGSN